MNGRGSSVTCVIRSAKERTSVIARDEIEACAVAPCNYPRVVASRYSVLHLSDSTASTHSSLPGG
jgi:hypothetical protein